jgi:2-oxoglutarate/2-oxoacid ferredoxin oxidoreductase subunit beta
MTGGQCSATTPITGKTSSGFLSELEAPLDICRVAAAAGAPYVDRALATGRTLAGCLVQALRYPGFSLVDIWGLCPGRYSKRNRMTPAQMEEDIKESTGVTGLVADNQREEYSAHYHRLAGSAPAAAPPVSVETICDAPIAGRCGVLLLGSAGQYINTVGEILCLAGMSGGLHVSQKNDYPITVLRGHSIAEVVLDREPIEYTGIGIPTVVLCVAAEGVARRKKVFGMLTEESLVVKVSTLSLPQTRARVIDLDCADLKIRPSERALAALATMAREGILLKYEMLAAGLGHRYRGKMLDEALAVAARICDR